MPTPAALVSCCNEALAEIGAEAIADFAEDSVEAANCRIFAPNLLLEIAEWAELPHLIRRANLTPVTNDRASEWNFAYAEPDSMGFPLAVRAAEDDAGTLPIYGSLPVQDTAPLRFIVEGGVIYTNVEDAALVYTHTEFTAALLGPTMRRAFVLELASRLAFPVKKDLKLQQAKSQAGEVQRARAIATVQNRTQQQQSDYISEAELARAGEA